MPQQGYPQWKPWNFRAAGRLFLWRKTSSFGILTEPTGVQHLSVWGSKSGADVWDSCRFILQDFHPQTTDSAMPRSFLVKSKRTHPLGQSRDSFRQQSQHQTDADQPVQHAMGQGRSSPEGAVQPLSPTVGVKDLLAAGCSPWDGMAIRSAPIDWPSGI